MVSASDTQQHTFEVDVEGKKISIRTGRMAKQANGACEVRCGETIVLVTCTESKEPRDGIDFFPLLCDFEEKLYSVGRVPGSFPRREGKASDRAVLVSRLIDRPIRPLFPYSYRNDVQIVATTLSCDQVTPPDTLAMLGASTALTIAGLPFMGPIGAVRVGRIDGKMMANPSYEELDSSDMDIVVAGTAESIMMVEAGCKLVNENDVLKAIDYAHKIIRKQVEQQLELAARLGVVKKEAPPEVKNEALTNLIAEKATNALKASMNSVTEKQVRAKHIEEALNAVLEDIAARPEDDELKTLSKNFIKAQLEELEATLMRAQVLETGLRADGRKCDEIRPITVEVGILPRTHGTGLFTRGTTQVLSIATLGIAGDAQKLDSIDPVTEKKYMHHYNFPGYSVGEVKPMRGAGRREIGHGALAERALIPVLPPQDEFPYTLRVVSEVLESNGSTSMASTCGSSLALMDAGVPLLYTIGGIAMGLILEDDKFAILSDIQGLEDFLGDMDFKVTGSREGITALQMDIKVQGISIEIMRVALEQARRGRVHIIDKMEAVLEKPRTELSPWAPRLITINIDQGDIGTVIGPGGKMIRRIIEETGATIDIADDGTIVIGSVNGAGGEAAKEMILRLVKKAAPGDIYMGKVTRIIPVGAFVEFLPGKEGMVHISQLENRRVAKVEEVVSVGQKVIVKVREIDERNRINLTMKEVTDQEKEECERKYPAK